VPCSLCLGVEGGGVSQSGRNAKSQMSKLSLPIIKLQLTQSIGGILEAKAFVWLPLFCMVAKRMPATFPKGIVGILNRSQSYAVISACGFSMLERKKETKFVKWCITSQSSNRSYAHMIHTIEDLQRVTGTCKISRTTLPQCRNEYV